MTAGAAPDTMRNAARAKVFQPGEMRIGFERRRVHLLDVSRTGALVHAEVPPPVGAAINLLADDPIGRARVVWVAGKKFGVVFSTALSNPQLAAIVDGHDRVRARLATQPRIAR